MDAQKKIADLEPDFVKHEVEFRAYFQAVETAIKVKKVFFEKSDGTPRFDSLKDALDAIQSPYVWKTLITKSQKGPLKTAYEYFKQQEKALKINNTATNLFTQARNEIDRRIHEAEVQHRVLHQNHDEIKFMVKHFFGDLNPETKTLITPTKEKIQKSIICLIPPKIFKEAVKQEINPVCKVLFS
jgi:hypothetical protein